MGFFSFLFPQPFYISDAVFGRLRREGINKRTGKAWFVNDDLTFTPTRQRIGIYLDAPETGPNAAQQAFFQHIEQHYDKLSKQLIPLFEHSFQYRSPLFRIQNFADEFQLTDISIPTIAAGQKESVAWEWSFSSVHDTIHTFTIYMHDDIPEPIVQMDG